MGSSGAANGGSGQQNDMQCNGWRAMQISHLARDDREGDGASGGLKRIEDILGCAGHFQFLSQCPIE
jgi:hypothetical protein